MSRVTDYVCATNQTGAAIVKGHITHGTEDYGLQSIQLEGLAPGASTVPIPAYTGPSSRDYWYICWTTDGTNYTAWSGIQAINSHGSPEAPGTVTLFGEPGKAGLKVTFVTDGTQSNTYTIPSPWG